MGKRLSRVTAKACVRVRRARGPGSGRGRKVYELGIPVAAPNAAEVLRSVFVGGQVAAKAGAAKARGLGLTVQEIYDGLKALGVPVRRGGRGAYVWRLPEGGATSARQEPHRRGRPKNSAKVTNRDNEYVQKLRAGVYRGPKDLHEDSGLDPSYCRRLFRQARAGNYFGPGGAVKAKEFISRARHVWFSRGYRPSAREMNDLADWALARLVNRADV